MTSCVVKWCRQKKECSKSKHQTGISYHNFPKDEVRRMKWTKAVRLERREEDWMPTSASRVCSIHFSEEDMYLSGKGYCMLKKSAVPICTMVRKIKFDPKEKESSEMQQDNMIQPQDISTPSCSQWDSNCKENQGLPTVVADPKSIKLLEQHSPEQYFSTNSRPHKHKRMVKCSNCSYIFDVHDEEIKEYVPPNKKRNILKDIDTNTIQLNTNPISEDVTMGVLQNSCRTPINVPSSDMESVFNTPKTHKLKQKLKQKTLLAEKRLSKIKNLQRKNKRLQKKNHSLKNILAALKKKGFKESNMHLALGDFPEDIISNLKKKKNKTGRTILKYTKTVKKFALTLNYYSPAAYKYVRRKFMSCLPHPSTLSKWYQVVDGKPGFTEEAFRALKLKYSHVETGQNLACLMADEMSIRQQKIFNGKDIDGLVTFGPSDETATQVYVLMLVALNDSFKLPLGYFFINGLGAEQRCNLINMCLQKCHEVGAEIVSLTFDGCPSNFAMAKQLGCSFEDVENMTTHFPHPTTGMPVVIILDPCHMVKLIRNTFEAKKTLIDQNGELIQWKHLVDLKKLQDDIGLHFGNKLSEKHLQFRNNIMNVKLATQTLSNSVAVALKLCCNELKIPNFLNAIPTVNFIEIINNLFDILNCRSLHGKGYKHPFFIDKKDELMSFLENAKTYLLGLKINVEVKRTKTVQQKKQTECTPVQKPLTETKSKTGFMGLLICIASFKMLYENLVVQHEILKYVLPYKFSQDHLELFFGVIRNHGRCNNNPNARQFMGLYKKTLLNLELSSKFTGNCIPLEDFPILNCSSVINRTTPGYRQEFEEAQTVNNDQCTENNNCQIMSQMLDDRQLPETIAQIVGYIAGFVAKKLAVKIQCSHCSELLLANEKLYFHKLISLKDFGGLSYPSVILFKICHQSETILRQIIKLNTNGKNLTRDCNLAVILNRCFAKNVERSDILTAIKNNHISGGPNHETLLIKGIIEEYLRTRLHYIAKNDCLINSNRQKLNKLVIFRGT